MADLALRILLQAQDMMSNVVKGAGSALQDFGGTASGVGPILGVVAGAALAVGGALLSCVQPAADFQQSVLKISAYAGLSKQQTDAMSQSLLDMAGAVGVGPKELADALYPIISSGYQASDALNILKLSAETAAASGAQTSVVADALTTSLGAMHAPASEAGHYMDMLNKIVSIGKGEVPQYAAVIGKLSLAASGAGVDFGTMGAALATLTTHGFPSVAQASTSLGNLFTQIGVKTDALAKHAQAAGVAFDAHKFATLDLAGKLDYLQKITGGNQSELLKLVGGSTVALKAFNALEGGSKDLQTNLNAMKNSAGATDDAFKTASSGLNASMARAQASVQALQVKIGTALLPVFTSIITNITPLIASFSDWITKSAVLQTTATALGNAFSSIGTALKNTVTFFQNNQTAMDALKAVLAGVAAGVLAFAIVSIPPLIVAFGAWAVAAGAAALATLAATWPFIAIGAVVAAVVFGIIEAVQHWGEITKFAQGVWTGFASWFMGALGAVGNFFHNLWNGILSGLKTAWNAIVNTVKVGAMLLLAVVMAPILGIAAAFVWLYNHNYYFKALIDAIVGVVKAGLAWVQTAWQVSAAWLVGVWQGIVKFATDLWNQISGAIKTGFTAAIGFVASVWAAISSFFINAWANYIAKPLAAMWTNVSTFFSGVWTNYIAGPIGSLWNSLSSTVSGWATKALDWGKNLIQGFVNGIVSKANSVAGAVGGIAGQVLAFLGFHSPTKEGPGREADQWAPNLVKMYSQGIESGIPQIQNAVNKLTKPIAMSLGVTNTGITNTLGNVNLKASNSSSSSPLQGGSSANGVTVINNTFNISTQGGWSRNQVDDMYKQIKQKLDRDYRNSGNHITNTSGGRV